MYFVLEGKYKRFLRAILVLEYHPCKSCYSTVKTESKKWVFIPHNGKFGGVKTEVSLSHSFYGIACVNSLKAGNIILFVTLKFQEVANDVNGL